MRTISEPEFASALRERLAGVSVRAVTGPGRSGAIAGSYASHVLRVPYLPFGQVCPEHLRPLLVIDTAEQSGATLRKARRQYPGSHALAVFREPPRVRFWYEAGRREVSK